MAPSEGFRWAVREIEGNDMKQVVEGSTGRAA